MARARRRSVCTVLAIEPQNERESELHARAHGELGNVYYAREDYERAEEYFKKSTGTQSP